MNGDTHPALLVVVVGGVEAVMGRRRGDEPMMMARARASGGQDQAGTRLRSLASRPPVAPFRPFHAGVVVGSGRWRCASLHEIHLVWWCWIASLLFFFCAVLSTFAPKDLITSCARGGGECFLPRNKLASRTWAPPASNSSGGERCFVHASGPVRLTRNGRSELFLTRLFF